MASGHVNRTNRPNTWLHRPPAARVKKVLANPEPSTHGPTRTEGSASIISSSLGISRTCRGRVTDGQLHQPRNPAGAGPIARMAAPRYAIDLGAPSVGSGAR